MSGGSELTLAALSARRREINLSELYELIELCAAFAGNHGALVIDVLRLLAFEIALLAHHAHEVKALRAAGKASDKRSGGFVFTALNLYAYSVYHSSKRLPRGLYSGNSPESVYEGIKGNERFGMGGALPEDD